MLIKVNLLHGQELAGLERHDVHVEVVLGRGGQQLAQPKDFTIARKQRLRVCAADLHLRAAGLRQRSSNTSRRDVALLVHERGSRGSGRHAVVACARRVSLAACALEDGQGAHMCAVSGGKYAKSSGTSVRWTAPACTSTEPSRMNMNLRAAASGAPQDGKVAAKGQRTAPPPAGAAPTTSWRLQHACVSASRRKERLVPHAPRFSKYMVKRAPVACGDTRTAPCAFRLGRTAVSTERRRVTESSGRTSRAAARRRGSRA